MFDRGKKIQSAVLQLSNRKRLIQGSFRDSMVVSLLELLEQGFIGLQSEHG